MTQSVHPEPTMTEIENLKLGDIFYVEMHQFRFHTKEEAVLPTGDIALMVETAAGTTFLFNKGDHVRAIVYTKKETI